MNSFQIGMLSLVMLFFYVLFYSKINDANVHFGAYIYLAMFPFKLDALPLLAYSDAVLKAIVMLDFLIWLIRVANFKVRVSWPEIYILLVVIAGYVF